MKYVCLGYLEPGKFENMSESERNTVFDECFSYNDELRKNGHLVVEEALQPPNTAVTVYWKNGKVVVTDGPYAETKEQLGGVQVLEARDLNHAIQLISQSPGVKRAATEKGYVAMRAAISSEPHATCRRIPQSSRCPNLDIGCRNRASSYDAVHCK
jgi:hypothetical protein